VHLLLATTFLYTVVTALQRASPILQVSFIVHYPKISTNSYPPALVLLLVLLLVQQTATTSAAVAVQH
jgi:hypothetical protein